MNQTCYRQANESALQLEYFFTSIKTISVQTALLPLDELFSHFVKLSDTFYACGGTHMIGKAKTRVTSWVGFFDLLFVYLWAATTQDELFQAWWNILA